MIVASEVMGGGNSGPGWERLQFVYEIRRVFFFFLVDPFGDRGGEGTEKGRKMSSSSGGRKGGRGGRNPRVMKRSQPEGRNRNRKPEKQHKDGKGESKRKEDGSEASGSDIDTDEDLSRLRADGFSIVDDDFIKQFMEP